MEWQRDFEHCSNGWFIDESPEYCNLIGFQPSLYRKNSGFMGSQLDYHGIVVIDGSYKSGAPKPLGK